jgi:hypothetical protein
MLIDSGLPKSFWEDAMSTSVFLRNRLPTTANEGKVSPMQVWKGIVPKLSFAKVFGSKCYVHNKPTAGAKLDSRAIEGTFVGFAPGHKGYRIYIPSKNRVYVRRHIRFLETPVDHSVDDADSSSDNDNLSIDTDKNKLQPMKANDQSDDSEPDNDSDRTDTDCDVPASIQNDDRNVPVVPNPIQRYPTRSRVPMSSLNALVCSEVNHKDFALLSETIANSVPTPKSYNAAVNGPNADEWIDAINDELASMNKNNVWKPCFLPTGAKAIGCVWIFKIKQDADGKVERFKARLCAQGFSQRPGIDFNDTFAPVARTTTIRTLIALAASKGYALQQLDVKTAFLHGKLEEKIYMKMPKGMHASNTGNVLRLHKSIYGLKQASRVWNKLLTEYFRRFGLVQSTADPCLFLLKQGDDLKLATAVVVDDLITLVSNDGHGDYKKLLECLRTKFDITDKGNLEWCIGILVTRNKHDGAIRLSQERYVLDLLDRFGLTNANPQKVPADVSMPLSKNMSPTTEDEEKRMTAVPYRQLVGALLYLANVTRPDIAYSVGVLSRFLNCYGELHWRAAKKVLRYLKGTAKLGLVYKKEQICLLGYADASYANDLDTRRSTTGNLFQLTPNSSPVSWRSKLQPTTAQSTAEAEYMSAVSGGNETVWLRRLLSELCEAQCDPTALREDNQSCIALTENPVFHERTKHIDVKFHVIRNYVEQGFIKLKYCPTKDQLADLLTKALPGPRLAMLRSKLIQ